MKLATFLEEQSPAVVTTAPEVAYAASTVELRRALEKYSGWCERVMGQPIHDLLLLNLDIPWEHLVVPDLLREVPLRWNDRVENLSPDSPRIVRFELPEIVPYLELWARVSADLEDGWTVRWHPTWHDLPVALWFEGQRTPAIALKATYVGHDDGTAEQTASLWLMSREAAPGLLASLARSLRSPRKEIKVYGNRDVRLPADAYRWDRVVLDPTAKRMVQDDFESFLRGKQWFADHGLPYRRGYLFYGAPGNGKTSALRVMAAHPRISPYMIDLGSEDATNSTLTSMFQQAAWNAPSLIIFEDLDRMFVPDSPEASRRQVTLQHLLNCLDGIANEEGLIVVATANEPAALDPAILRRPGRFDKVVEFRPPAFAERREFYRRQKGLRLSSGELDRAADITNEFSFAQLREAYIVAGQQAFDTGSPIGLTELEEAVAQLRAAQRDVSQSSGKRTLGFHRFVAQA